MEVKSDKSESRLPLAECLRWLTGLCGRRAKLTILLAVLSAVGCIAYTIQTITFKTDRADLIDPSAEFQKRWQRHTDRFENAPDLVVVVESKQTTTIKQILDDLGERLKAEPTLFSNVMYKIEQGKLREKGLQYLSPEALTNGLERLNEYQPVLAGRWNLIRLDGLVPRITNQLKRLEQQGQLDDSVLLAHADRLASSLAATLHDHNDFTNPWPDVLPADPILRDQGSQAVYLLNDDGSMGVVMASPFGTDRSFESAATSIDKLRQLIRAVAPQFPNAKITLTGIPVIENDEMQRSQSDVAKALIISFLGVAFVVFIGFRSVVGPMLGLLTLSVGMAWSLGYATVVVEHLNIVSVPLVVILAGLSIGFSVHMLARYRELRQRGLGQREALVEAAGCTGSRVATGAVATAVAFFCAALTTFRGAAEVGIIAGGGILLAALAAFTFLPAIVSLADRNNEPRSLPAPFKATALRYATQHHPWLVLISSLALIACLCSCAFDWTGPVPKSRVVYDHNVLHLQAEGQDSVDAQRRLFESSKQSLLYAISIANSAEEARAMKRRLEALPTVHHVQELASRMPAAAASETKLLVQGFNAQLARLPAAPPAPAPLDPQEVGQAIEDLHGLLLPRADVVSQRIAANLDRFLNEIGQLSQQDQVMFLSDYQYRMTYALLTQFQAIAAASNPEPVEPNDLPPDMKQRFVSPQGHWLLQIYPKEQIWDLEPLERFVSDIRSVDPEVTGVPLRNLEAARQIKHRYKIWAIHGMAAIMLTLLLGLSRQDRLLWTFLPPAAMTLLAGFAMPSQIHWSPAILLLIYATLAMATALLVDQRAVIHAALALLPPVAGMGITFGLLFLLDIPLNPANLIILPLILGIGVDNGVHIIHDFRSQPDHIYRMAPSTTHAILLTSMTMMIGCGSMMIAAHRGLYSLGVVLSIAVGASLFVSLITLPALLTLLARFRQRVPSTDSGPPVRQTASLVESTIDVPETADTRTADEESPATTEVLSSERVG